MEIFCNEESSILCTIQLSGVIFRDALECQLRKLFLQLEDEIYNSKNVIAAVKNFSVEVDRTLLNVHSKNLVKITKVGEKTSINKKFSRHVKESMTFQALKK